MGFKLEFTTTPFQTGLPSVLHFSKSDSAKIDTEFQSLQRKGALKQVQPEADQFLSNLFLVRKRDGISRPVISLKGLNRFLQYTYFKMENTHLLRDLVQPGDWLGKVDLKDAYFVVPIWKGHWKYLRFLWKDTFLEFACLPFGLTLAPRLFTKILKLVVALPRWAGIRLIIYLDDLLFMHATQEGLQEKWPQPTSS